MNQPPRVAFFTDSFHEVNGVGLTSRQFEAFAARRNLPFFSYHGGPETKTWREGSITRFEVRRGPLSFALDADLRFDIGFLRHKRAVEIALKQFRPDLIHITGPGDCGLMGALCAWRLGVPTVASWHTNVHEFFERRIRKTFAWVPEGPRNRIATLAREFTLTQTLLVYRPARIVFAPNDELIEMLRARTGRAGFLMRRGVDTVMFSPEKRDRAPEDGTLVLGFAGRLFPEKNVRFLAKIETALLEKGFRDFRFLVVGHGSEAAWLEKQMNHLELTGLLRGEPLARAFANMDLFVFPSHTDTFGNVVQEALASGVPAVVTASGGPKSIVRDGETGIVAADDEAFLSAVIRLFEDRAKLEQMKIAARQQALAASWDSVFEKVYASYEFGRHG